jgi:LacI family transcriptional regulator
MKTVAQQANVSISTVSRVLNGTKAVSPELHKAVWDAVKKLGYKPNIAARFMKGQKTGSIGILVPDIRHPFYSDIVAGAITEAHKSYNTLIVSSSNGDADHEEETLYNLSMSVLDGLIYIPISRNAPFSELEIFKEVPLVIAYRRNIFKNRPQVYVDNIKGGYIATKYLIKLKRKRIAFIAGFFHDPYDLDAFLQLAASPVSGAYSTMDRFNGYLKALEEEGIPFDPSLVLMCKYNYIDGYNVAVEMLSKSIDVDGIIAFNDSVASGVIKLLLEQGISVPEDISVIGYDDGPIAPILSPSLTSVKQDAYMIGVKAADMMLRLLNGEEVKDEILDVSLSIRNSTSVRKESGA